MNVIVSDLMQAPVMTVTKHQTLGHVRKLLAEHRVSALPVTVPGGELVGIVTSSDLVAALDRSDESPVSAVMTRDPYSVPPGESPHIVARIMRNHHLHHVVVVDDGRVVGMLSTFDLLRLVEDHRYVAKAPPTPTRKVSGRR